MAEARLVRDLVDLIPPGRIWDEAVAWRTKSGGGVDPLTDAPAPIPAAQRKETGVDFKPEKAKKDAA